MDYLARLKAAYREHAGIAVVSGLSPYHFGNYRDAPFMHYLRGGESAVALAMMNQEASVVVIDPQTGIELTNWIAFRERLSCIAVPGSSPGDNARIIQDYCPCAPDFVLIDGLHSNEQIVLDFNATFAVSGREVTYFFGSSAKTVGGPGIDGVA